MAAWARPMSPSLDLDLPGESGLDLCRWLLSECTGVHALMLSYWDWDVLLAAAHEAGAYGFLLRSASIKELRTAIRLAAAAPIWTELQLQRADAYQRDVGRRLTALAPRERQVLGLLAAGLSNTRNGRRRLLAQREYPREARRRHPTQDRARVPQGLARLRPPPSPRCPRVAPGRGGSCQ